MGGCSSKGTREPEANKHHKHQLDSLIARLQQLNPKSTSDQMRKGLKFNQDGDLQDWNLSFCHLETIPEEFGAVSVRGFLDLDNNKLTSLPESFAGLTVGGNLDLSSNQLTSLPESFGSLTVGGSLYLQVNQLSELPKSFKDVTVGESLYLQDNQISEHPNEFLNVKAMVYK